MSKIKDIDPDTVDNTMSAISSVLKAIITVAKCIESFKQKDELSKPAVV